MMDVSQLPKLGKLLRKLRRSRRLTVAQVAAKIPMGSESLRLLEEGKESWPEPHDLYYLAEQYNVEYLDLMRMAGHIRVRVNHSPHLR